MPMHAITCLALAAAASLPNGDVVVAVSPCIVGPEIQDDLGAAVTETVVAALDGVSGIRVLDRSLTTQTVREQDLVLISRASSVLPARFGDLGAQQVLVAGLLNRPSGFLLSLRLIKVATGEVLRSAVHQVPSERKLLAKCGGWAKTLWAGGVATHEQRGATVSVYPALKDVWDQLDQAQARRLLGPDLDRAESVYRQYLKAVRADTAEEAERLSRLAAVYLTDCLSLLQCALHPPEGMVYVPAGWVTLPAEGGKTRRFWLDGFFIDRCEYTCDQYARLLEATGGAKALGWLSPDEQAADLPVTGVTWYDAEVAAASRGMRLPSYPQWLRAIRGEHRQKYPWGDVWRAEYCAFARDPRHPVPEPVGSHPGNAGCFGVLDGVGSVFEWLDSWHDSTYWDRAPVRNPPGPRHGSAKLAVGGSYRSGPDGCTCSSVQQLTPGTRKDDLGFRCVLPLKGNSTKVGSP